jgi:colanic acid biosynthesis glycosyl transferase WcaI
VDPARVAALPNFTHIAAVPADRAAARRRLGWPDDRVLAVHTGNMGRKQGLETVVEAARLAESIGETTTFVLVGDGNQRDVLRAAGSACRNLMFVDPLDARDYPYALAAADVLLVNERPGVQEMSLPSKVTSYVVSGRPIVAAVEPAGITGAFLSQHGVALCSPAGDAPGMLRAVAEATDPERARALVRSAQELHERLYSRGAAEARYAAFVEELGDAVSATARRAPGGPGVDLPASPPVHS